MTISGTDFKSYQDKHMIIIRFPEPFTLSSAKAGIIVVDKNIIKQDTLHWKLLLVGV